MAKYAQSSPNNCHETLQSVEWMYVKAIRLLLKIKSLLSDFLEVLGMPDM